MMGRGLQRCAGCLFKLDPGENAPSRWMQGTYTVHTYHLTIRLWRVHRVLRVAPLELCGSSDWKALQFSVTITFYMMSNILFLPVAISTDRSTDRPCALDMCNTARSFRHQSNTCVIRRLAFLNLGSIEQMSCTPLPATLYNLASQNSGLSTNFKILR